ncbi:MAG: hypothetical protein M0T73_17590 [Deltaproteobacteria bacterium]|nr:hypothetical protein [Deltaproteobacteria bacterium]
MTLETGWILRSPASSGMWKHCGVATGIDAVGTILRVRGGPGEMTAQAVPN